MGNYAIKAAIKKMKYKCATQECSLKIKCSSPKKPLKLTPMRQGGNGCINKAQLPGPKNKITPALYFAKSKEF
jgi:hypothetical protein